MGFTDAIRKCLRDTFVMSGRAPRSEYWWFQLFVVLYMLAAGAIFYFIYQTNPSFPTWMWGPVVLLALPLVWFYVALLFVTVRRLHDRGFSGWWVLASLVSDTVVEAIDAADPGGIAGTIAAIASFVLAIFILALLIMRGTPGPNKYGEDPTGFVDETVFA